MNEDLSHDSVVSGHSLPLALASNEGGKKLAEVIKKGQEDFPENLEDRPLLVCKPHKIESWRVFKIMAEFVEGFDVIRRYGLAASIFGTARATFEHPVYEHATELAKRLSERGFAIITGGAAGVMQAANKGAYEAGGASVGLNIELEDGQKDNQYLTDKFSFDHFFVRKVMLTYASEVYIYFPGGFGTLDEFFEILTLVQTKKIRQVPIILFGKSYWEPLVDFFKNTLYLKHHAIDLADMDLFHLVDSVDEAVDYITENVKC